MWERDSRAETSTALITRAVQLINSGYAVSEVLGMYPTDLHDAIIAALRMMALMADDKARNMFGERIFRCMAPYDTWGPWTVVASHVSAQRYWVRALAEEDGVQIEGTVRYAGERQKTSTPFSTAIALETSDTVGTVEVCFRSPEKATSVVGAIRTDVPADGERLSQ